MGNGINLLGGLKLINKKPEFSQMTIVERKRYLSNDLIDRMIRIEQKVSASFGHPLKYNETEYYKNLTDFEKKRFKEYLGQKKKSYSYLVFLIASFSLFMFRMQMTGQSFLNIDVNNFNSFDYFILCLFLVFLILWIPHAFKAIKRRKKHRHLKRKIFGLVDLTIGHKKHKK
jgi:hypothetical protein